jgi:hypothetical protein
MSVRRGLIAGLVVALLVTLWRSDVDQASFALGDKGEQKPSETEAQNSRGQTKLAGHTGPGCLVVDNFFADEVWSIPTS